MRSAEVILKPPSQAKIRQQRLIQRLEKEAEVISLALQGKSIVQIAGVTEYDNDQIANLLKGYRKLITQLSLVKGYESNKAEILSGAELLALKSVTDKVEKATCREATIAFEKIHNAGRLERNKSTENISVGIKYTSVPSAELIED